MSQSTPRPPASLKNRTGEFAAAVNSFRLAARGPPAASQLPLSLSTPNGASESVRAPLLSFDSQPSAAAPRTPVSSANSAAREFNATARRIATGIQGTTAKLEHLGRLARRRTLFDDRPTEISDLTVSVKNDITTLNSEIRALQVLAQQSAARSRRDNKQETEHSENVVVGLKNSLAKTSQNFAELLEIRTETLRAQKERRDQYSASTQPQMFLGDSSSASPASLLPMNQAHDSPLYDPIMRTKHRYPGSEESIVPTSSMLSRSSMVPYQVPGTGTLENDELIENQAHVAIDMQMTQSELAQVDMQMAYLDQRNTAVESIEKTISELAQIFQQLGSLVAQQREQVMRIDDNVADIESNVDMARSELLKYWTSMSSNRMLMAKIFAVIVFFFFIFLLVL